MEEFNPQAITRLVFDINSIFPQINKEWENFKSFIRVLEDRSYKIIFIGKDCQIEEWQSFNDISIIIQDTFKTFKNNVTLSGNENFWITDDNKIQKELLKKNILYAFNKNHTGKKNRIHYNKIYELLEVLNPSKSTINIILNKITKLKQKNPSVPLTIGIGGPEGCGHSFFVGELVNMLEDKNQLVSGIDLSELLGIEFKENASEKYWRSNVIHDFIIHKIMNPFSKGKKIIIEKEPDSLTNLEISTFPFYLIPEMILIVWGSTIFLPELDEFINFRILLELSDKAIASRAFNLDERNNFDESFVKSYKKSDGLIYSQYLKKFSVQKKIDFQIDFDNFHSFKIKNFNTS